MSEMIKPSEIDVQSYQLAITWKDGHRSVYPMRLLRQYCRCANCIDEVTGEDMLDKSTVPDMLRCMKAEPIGHYAVAFSFSDMHKTGIYTYTYLRHLCPCTQCKV